MNKQVRVRPQAETDIRDARNWYEEQRAGLGDEFLVSVARTLGGLEQQPERFVDYYRGFRRAFVPRFPYKVFFRIEADWVIIFRVLHAARSHPAILDKE